MTTEMTTKNPLRQARLQRHLSQAQLSRLTGISQALLSAYELEKAAPSKEHERLILWTLEKLDRSLNGRPAKELFQKTRWSKGVADSRVAQRRRAITLDEIRGFTATLTPGDCAAPNGLTAVSLFAGCGGLTQGFTTAGFDVRGFVELNAAARSIFTENFPNTEPLGADIRSITDAKIGSWVDTLGPIDVVFGGPPCQGFSLTGKRDRWDPRNQLYKEFVRVVGVLKPQAFVMENVRLLTSMKSPQGVPVTDLIEAEFQRLGYSCEYRELNAQDYGVPQFRERVFFIGFRDQRVPGFPNATHGDGTRNLFEPSLEKRLTFRDAVRDLAPLESGESYDRDPLHFAVDHPSHVVEMLRDVPEGKSAHDHPDPARRPKSGYNTTYKRLKWDEPCSTVGTTFGMISGSRNVHPRYTRSLTIREAARCQTFPDSFRFFGSLGDIRTTIGNAVPPILGRAIASCIAMQLQDVRVENVG